jgi:chromosome segregation ATPase
MSKMSEQPLTRAVLAEVLQDFHRDVMRPDLQREIQEAVGGSERRMLTHIDGLAHRVESMAIEVKLTVAALRSVEERLGEVEARLDKVETRLDQVETRLGKVEARLDGMDERLAVLARQYADLLASHHRLQERLSRLDNAGTGMAAVGEVDSLRSEVRELASRVDALREDIRQLEARIDASTRQSNR